MNIKSDKNLYLIDESYNAFDIGEEDQSEDQITFWRPNVDGLRIEACVNTTVSYKYFKYIRAKSDTEFGKICRIRIDKPEYVYHKGDTVLTKYELRELIGIFNTQRIFNNEKHTYWEWLNIDIWKCYLWYGGSKEKPTVFPPMPDYSKLPTSD